MTDATTYFSQISGASWDPEYCFKTLSFSRPSIHSYNLEHLRYHELLPNKVEICQMHYASKKG
jgi:hypothetical protein